MQGDRTGLSISFGVPLLAMCQELDRNLQTAQVSHGLQLQSLLRTLMQL